MRRLGLGRDAAARAGAERHRLGGRGAGTADQQLKDMQQKLDAADSAAADADSDAAQNN